MPDENDWSPHWELCGGVDQCNFPGGGPEGSWGRYAEIVLQRCQTEDGNWLYMAVTPDGGVGLAVEQVEKS